MKIVAIHAHPDDVEFLAAGTLALLKQNGHQISIATLSTGDKGTPDKSMEEIAAIRQNEAEQSASLLGADYHCLGMADFEIFDDDASRRKVTDLIRKIKPDIILTASPIDYMADHEAASLLVRNASFVAGIRNYHTETEPTTNGIPAFYYMDSIEGTDHFGKTMLPEFCVDISSVMETKEAMLSCHQSQREWLQQHHGVDQYILSMKEWSGNRGKMIGREYAEGFRQHKGHAYPQHNLLEELLPDGTVHFVDR